MTKLPAADQLRELQSQTNGHIKDLKLAQKLIHDAFDADMARMQKIRSELETDFKAVLNSMEQLGEIHRTINENMTARSKEAQGLMEANLAVVVKRLATDITDDAILKMVQESFQYQFNEFIEMVFQSVKEKVMAQFINADHVTIREVTLKQAVQGRISKLQDGQ